MGIALSRESDASFLRLDGAIEISVAAELKAALLQAIEAAKSIHVSVAAVSELDVTAYQLIWAAAHEAKRRQMQFIFAGEITLHVKSALSEIGLEGFSLIE